jgi:hypothetical protein
MQPFFRTVDDGSCSQKRGQCRPNVPQWLKQPERGRSGASTQSNRSGRVLESRGFAPIAPSDQNDGFSYYVGGCRGRRYDKYGTDNVEEGSQ